MNLVLECNRQKTIYKGAIIMNQLHSKMRLLVNGARISLLISVVQSRY